MSKESNDVNIGDIVDFKLEVPVINSNYRAFEAGYHRLTKFVNETGIVVSKDKFSDYICVSIKRYNGDYTMCKKSLVKKKCIPIEYKLSLISNFGEWWYSAHMSLYQSLLIEAI